LEGEKSMKSSFKEFLLRELNEVRKELIETASKIKLPEYVGIHALI